MTELGSDFSGTTDVDRALGEVDGKLAVLQQILRRLSSIPGQLLEKTSYGYDLRLLIGSSIEPSIVEGKIEEQIFDEEAVESAEVTVTFSEDTSTMTVEATIETTEGDLDFTLAVNELTVEILKTV